MTEKKLKYIHKTHISYLKLRGSINGQHQQEQQNEKFMYIKKIYSCLEKNEKKTILGLG
jgi:hypothetical protein